MPLVLLTAGKNVSFTNCGYFRQKQKGTFFCIAEAFIVGHITNWKRNLKILCSGYVQKKHKMKQKKTQLRIFVSFCAQCYSI